MFKNYIQKYNIETPGREEDADEILQTPQVSNKKQDIYNAHAILLALGGKENINTLDNCVTRLRLNVEDMTKVNEKELKRHGPLAIMKLDEHNLQVVIGAQVQSVKTGIEELL